MSGPVGLCEGRAVIVTGAGRGLGREYALELARQGARVVVNDLGSSVDGGGADAGLAAEVVADIIAGGGEAVANGDDISTPVGASRVFDQAMNAFGVVHGVVNNAGILRDRFLTNMNYEEWTSVLHVHLGGTFSMSQEAARRWRDQAKVQDAPVDCRIVNVSSSAGLFGNPGQTNYAAAKAGIAAFTMVAAMELRRYGVTVNAVAPVARTRMTEAILTAPECQDSFDRDDPVNLSPLVAWLCSPESAKVSGRVFEVGGHRIVLCAGWSRGPRADNGGRRWDPSELGPIVADLVAAAPPREKVVG